MLKVKISHPDRDEERQILDLMGRTSAAPETQQVVTVEDILKAREVINNIYIDDKVKDYIVDMVCCTREPARYEIEVTDFIQLGASPRATVALTLTAKAHAFLRGRGFVTPQDVKSVAQDVLRHRVSVTFEAEAEENLRDDHPKSSMNFRSLNQALGQAQKITRSVLECGAPRRYRYSLTKKHPARPAHPCSIHHSVRCLAAVGVDKTSGFD